MIRAFFLCLLLLPATACRKGGSGDPGPLPRMDDAGVIREYHRKLNRLVRRQNKPEAACRLAEFGIIQLLLASRGLPAEDPTQVFGNFSITCNLQGNPDECAALLFGELEQLYDKCERSFPDRANWGKRFLRWQGVLKASWDRMHFEEAMDLLDSPVGRFTRLVLAGAFLHAVGLLPERPELSRTTDFVRWLGFPCPAWAASFTAAGPLDSPDDWPQTCLPSCPQAGITEPLADFELRAERLARACPPETVGLTRTEDYRYYTLDNHLVFRTGTFLRKLIDSILTDPHPLSRLFARLIREKSGLWQELALPLFFNPPVHKGQPFERPSHSRAAALPVHSPVVWMDPFGTTLVEEVTWYLPATGEVKPGVQKELDAGGSFNRSVRAVAALTGDFTIALSGRTSSDQLLILAGTMAGQGHTTLRLLFRNSSQVLRACELQLGALAPEETDLHLTFGPEQLTLSSKKGPLAGNSFVAQGAYDFSGLRQKLEFLRPRTPRAARLHLTVQSGISLSTIARLIGYVQRNASGRPLFSHVSLVTPNPGSDPREDAGSAP